MPPLLAWVSSQMTQADLVTIAEADYQFDVEANLAALVQISRGDLSALRPLTRHPREVMELTRWTEPSPGARAEHLQRLFCCTALLIAAADPSDAGRTDSINETLIAATSSIVEEFPEKCGAFLGLLTDLSAPPDALGHERAFIELARLIVLSANGAPAADLAEALDRADTLSREARESWLHPCEKRYGWVLEITHHRQRAVLWRRLLDGVITSRRADPTSASVVEHLVALAERRQAY